MKKSILKFLLVAGIATAGAQISAAQKNKFEIKTNMSSIQWTGKKLSGEHSGVIMLKNGNVEVADGKLIGGIFEIDMTTITNTDMEGEWKTKLEGHLKSDDFFGVEKFPTAKLEITKAEFVKDKNYNITGKLTIKGITNEIIFPATVEFDDKKFAAYADLNVDRSKYDVRYGSKTFFAEIGDKMIYDEFNLKVKIAAKK